MYHFVVQAIGPHSDGIIGFHTKEAAETFFRDAFMPEGSLTLWQGNWEAKGPHLVIVQHGRSYRIAREEFYEEDEEDCD